MKKVREKENGNGILRAIKKGRERGRVVIMTERERIRGEKSLVRIQEKEREEKSDGYKRSMYRRREIKERDWRD